MPVAAPIAGAVASGVVSKAMNKGGSAGSQTQDKSPWEPAQEPLKALIKDGQSLYQNLQQNPFSDTQKTAYQNQFTMADQYNNQIMPGLLQGFQKLLGPGFGDITGGLLGGVSGATQRQMPATQTYSPEQVQGAGSFIRQNIDNPALIKQEASRLGLSNADVLRAAQTQDPNINMNQVNQYMGRKDPQYAKPSFGLLDFSQYTPAIQAAAAQAQQLAAETPEERRRREEQEYWNWMMNYSAGAGTGSAGVGVGGAGDAAAAGAAASAGDGGVSV